jgi:AraC-like DNA-binding protein
MQAITLVIAASQALLFTFALLALLDIRFPGWRYLFREATYVLLLIAAIFTVYVCCPAGTFKLAFYLLAVLYALLLLHYTFLFIRSYRLFLLRMDNYFSDEEAGHLRWVAFSFFAALAVGVLALLSSLFMSKIIGILFAAVFNTFYLYFTIRFINYAYQFHIIERSMDDDAPDVKTPNLGVSTVTSGGITGIHENTLALLEKQIEEWIADKGFTEQGITIDTLADRFHTNTKYVSVYINTRKNQTFRKWINELRIEEAKNLLLQYPGMTGNEIARQTGFSDRSHFLRQFKKQTHRSPSEWKKLAETQNFHV